MLPAREPGTRMGQCARSDTSRRHRPPSWHAGACCLASRALCPAGSLPPVRAQPATDSLQGSPTWSGRGWADLWEINLRRVLDSGPRPTAHGHRRQPADPGTHLDNVHLLPGVSQISNFAASFFTFSVMPTAVICEGRAGGWASGGGLPEGSPARGAHVQGSLVAVGGRFFQPRRSLSRRLQKSTAFSCRNRWRCMGLEGPGPSPWCGPLWSVHTLKEPCMRSLPRSPRFPWGQGRVGEHQ